MFLKYQIYLTIHLIKYPHTHTHPIILFKNTSVLFFLLSLYINYFCSLSESTYIVYIIINPSRKRTNHTKGKKKEEKRKKKRYRIKEKKKREKEMANML